ncbi:MAG: hypothetical protein ACI9OJ_004675, partial [Myxococcota bacterium]
MNSGEIDELFELIRDDCPGALWSQGIGLSRAATVTLTTEGDDDEVVLKVTTPVAILARTVTLLPDDEDYLCDCSPKEEVCEHIVAAIITLKRADERGEPLVADTRPQTKIAYRLRRNKGGIGFFRVIDNGESDTPLRGSVGVAKLKSGGPAMVATPFDLAIERKYGFRDIPWVPPGQMLPLLKTLARDKELTLDGDTVELSVNEVGLQIVVSDENPANRSGSFLLKVEQDQSIRETFNNGVALCTQGSGARLILRPIGQSGLTAREMTDLREGQRYGAHQLSHLVGSVLPGLRKRIAVKVLSPRLPELTQAELHLTIDAQTVGHELVVTPTFVYGDPPIARVENDTLVVLGTLIPERDHHEERRLTRRLDSQLGLRSGHKSRFAGERAVAFAAKLSSWKGARTGDSLSAFHVEGQLHPQLIRHGDDDLEVQFSAGGLGLGGGGGSKTSKSVSAEVVMQAFMAGESLVPLDGGGWAPIPSSWLHEHGQILADLLAARAMNGTLPASGLVDAAKLCDALDEPAPPAFERLRVLVEEFEALPTAALPSDLTATLRPYQTVGVNWLNFCRRAGLGAMLADDMGLGKTLQALTAITGRTLVVAPTSVLHNWAAEAKRFRPDLKVSTYHGPKRELDETADITLTTYAILRIDIVMLAAETWNAVLLDEAQAIKNPDSKVARAAFRLNARWRVTLTGTPVENRLEELWSQLHFINPGLLGSRQDFKERYADPIVEGNPSAGARLRDRIRPFVLRRLKRDVAPELPPRTDHIIYCQLDETERAVYDAIRAATQEDIVNRLEGGGNVMEALEALLRLRQAASHAGLIPGQDAEHSTKVRVLVDRLEEAAA